MTVNIFGITTTVTTTHDDDTRYWVSPGLYCRTHFPV